jgi:hypothetical protein
MDQQETGESAMSARKRTSLDAVFGANDRPDASAPERGGEAADAGAAIRTVGAGSDPQDGARSAKRPSVRQHTAYLPIPVHEQLRRLAFEEDRKIHDYLMEGLDRVFADRGLPAIKDLS